MSQPTENKDCTGVEYIKLISSDKKEFLVKKEDAVSESKILKRMFEGAVRDNDETCQVDLPLFRSDALKVVCDYIEYKARISKLKDDEEIPDFSIPLEVGLQVFKAANFLQI